MYFVQLEYFLFFELFNFDRLIRIFQFLEFFEHLLIGLEVLALNLGRLLLYLVPYGLDFAEVCLLDFQGKGVKVVQICPEF